MEFLDLKQVTEYFPKMKLESRAIDYPLHFLIGPSEHHFLCDTKEIARFHEFKH